jgi:hypothetical protein
VYGAIHDQWAPTGPTGPYGYPTEDVTSKVYGQDEGSVSWDRGVFEHIAMHFPTGGGPGWFLPIGIHRAHEARGGLTGLLGFPVDAARGTPLHGTYMDFQNGVAVWHPPGHPHAGEWSFSSAMMRIVSFLITGNDGFPDGELDLFVRAVLERVNPDGTRTNILNKRFPHDGGDYDSADHTFSPPFTMELAKPLRGGHRFETMFASYNAEGPGSHDQAWGTVNHGLVHGVWDDDPYNWDVQPAYTVDNLWSMAETDTEHHQADFVATYRIGEFAEERVEGIPFRKQWWWKVNNFKTLRLSKDQYARTFADVDSSSVWGNINPLSYVDEGFESLYYHLVYKTICEPGNCFGMSVEAIYAQKGMSLFPQPVYRHGHPQPRANAPHTGEPDPELDPGLVNEFNIKHGYQTGHAVVGWFLRQFGQGLTRRRGRGQRPDHRGGPGQHVAREGPARQLVLLRRVARRVLLRQPDVLRPVGPGELGADTAQLGRAHRAGPRVPGPGRRGRDHRAGHRRRRPEPVPGRHRAAAGVLGRHRAGGRRADPGPVAVPADLGRGRTGRAAAAAAVRGGPRRLPDVRRPGRRRNVPLGVPGAGLRRGGDDQGRAGRRPAVGLPGRHHRLVGRLHRPHRRRGQGGLDGAGQDAAVAADPAVPARPADDRAEAADRGPAPGRRPGAAAGEQRRGDLGPGPGPAAARGRPRPRAGSCRWPRARSPGSGRTGRHRAPARSASRSATPWTAPPSTGSRSDPRAGGGLPTAARRRGPRPRRVGSVGRPPGREAAGRPARSGRPARRGGGGRRGCRGGGWSG